MPRPFFVLPCPAGSSVRILGPTPYAHPVPRLPVRPLAPPLPALAPPLPAQAPPPGLTPQPPRHARPQLQNLVHVRADGLLQGRQQFVLFRLEGAEPGGGPGQDGSVDCV